MNTTIFSAGYEFKKNMGHDQDIFTLARTIRSAETYEEFIDTILGIQIDHGFTSPVVQSIQNCDTDDYRELKQSFLSGFLSEETYIPVQEAAELFNVDPSAISRANSQGRFNDGEIYTESHVSYVLPSAVKRVFEKYFIHGKKRKRRS